MHLFSADEHAPDISKDNQFCRESPALSVVVSEPFFALEPFWDDPSFIVFLKGAGKSMFS